MKKEFLPQAKYDASNTKQFKFKFNLKTDADIIDFLEHQENRQGCIKNLIRKEIEHIARENNELNTN